MPQDRITGLDAAGARKRRRGARLVVCLMTVFVTALAAVHGPSADEIVAADEIGIHADRAPVIDDCVDCGEPCVQTVSCTVFGIVEDSAHAAIAAKWAWMHAPAALGPSRATAPPLRPPVTALQHSREQG